MEEDGVRGKKGLIAAYVPDGEGGGGAPGWSKIIAWSRGDGPLWVRWAMRIRAREAGCRDSGIGEFVVDALPAEEARPYNLSIGKGC